MPAAEAYAPESAAFRNRSVVQDPPALSESVNDMFPLPFCEQYAHATKIEPTGGVKDAVVMVVVTLV